MRFISTRGAEPCGFIDALARGRPADGGVYAPEDWPRLTGADVAAAAARPLAETVAALLERFAGRDLDPELTLSAGREAMAGFPHPAGAPLRELGPNLWLLDLAQGPTRVAADFEMQLLARVAERALVTRGRAVTLLLAAGAEDGPAAVEAFRGRAGLGLVVLFAAGSLDAARRRAVTDASALNVRAVEVEGDAEACRAMVAAAMADEALVSDARLGSIGPENPARAVLQAAPLLAAMARLGAPERRIAVAAPAAGSEVTTAAWTLARMGAPVERIVVAGGPGDPLLAALRDGVYRGPGAVWSDVFERLYHEAAGRHSLETVRAARAFAGAGCVDLPPRSRAMLAGVLGAAVVDRARAAAVLVAAQNSCGESLDAATAALAAAARAEERPDEGTPVIVPILSAAARATSAASGAAEERCSRMPAGAEALKAYLKDFTGLSRAA